MSKHCFYVCYNKVCYVCFNTVCYVCFNTVCYVCFSTACYVCFNTVLQMHLLMVFIVTFLNHFNIVSVDTLLEIILLFSFVFYCRGYSITQISLPILSSPVDNVCKILLDERELENLAKEETIQVVVWQCFSIYQL